MRRGGVPNWCGNEAQGPRNNEMVSNETVLTYAKAHVSTKETSPSAQARFPSPHENENRTSASQAP